MNPLASATPKQLASLDAYLAAGSHKAAAQRLGIRYGAQRHRIVELLRRTRLRNVAEATYWLAIQRTDRAA